MIVDECNFVCLELVHDAQRLSAAQTLNLQNSRNAEEQHCREGICVLPTCLSCAIALSHLLDLMLLSLIKSLASIPDLLDQLPPHSPYRCS